MRRALIVLALAAGGGIAAMYCGSLLAHRHEPPGAAALPRDERPPQAAAAAPTGEQNDASSGSESTVANLVAQASPAVVPENDPADEIKVQLQSIQADYREMSEQIYDRSPPLIEPSDRAALTMLQNEKRSDLARVLSPAEVELFEARINETPAPQRR